MHCRVLERGTCQRYDQSMGQSTNSFILEVDMFPSADIELAAARDRLQRPFVLNLLNFSRLHRLRTGFMRDDKAGRLLLIILPFPTRLIPRIQGGRVVGLEILHANDPKPGIGFIRRWRTLDPVLTFCREVFATQHASSSRPHNCC